MREGRCPVSGIKCEECGYYLEERRCFLEELIKVLQELVESKTPVTLKLDLKSLEDIRELLGVETVD